MTLSFQKFDAMKIKSHVFLKTLAAYVAGSQPRIHINSQSIYK